MKLHYRATLLALPLLSIFACKSDDDVLTTVARPQDEQAVNVVTFEAHSKTPNFLKTTSGFSGVNIYPLISSEDTLEESPNFIYGSMADGAGLLKNEDETFTLINNIEADYSIARIKLDKTFKPVSGEYITNAEATGYTAQCSGSLVTPNEHGFGPLYLSGGEWGGASKGVFVTNPNKEASSASFAQMLPAFGQWSTENAVVIGKEAYPDKTVAFIGDDHADNTVPSGQLGMYVGARGDLYNGQLFGLRVTDAAINFEVDMVEGQSYPIDFVALQETELSLLDAEAKAKGVMGFSRLEDIDWRKGSAGNNREIYFCVTGRIKPDLEGKGAKYGRVYKVTLNENDPSGAGTITCILDGDLVAGKAKEFHSPDNIVVTDNYVYIQEDPNGYFDNADKTHYARLYQYNMTTGELKVVLECDQVAAAAQGYGTTNSIWEITGMINISEQTGKPGSYLVITQNHGWEPADGSAFTDPKANANPDSRKEGSVLYVVTGLEE